MRLGIADIIRSERLVSDGHAVTADGFTRPPIAHPVGIHAMRDSFPLPAGVTLLPNKSFNAALSGMASAKNRFSRVFSSSDDLFFRKAACASFSGPCLGLERTSTSTKPQGQDHCDHATRRWKWELTSPAPLAQSLLLDYKSTALAAAAGAGLHD